MFLEGRSKSVSFVVDCLKKVPIFWWSYSFKFYAMKGIEGRSAALGSRSLTLSTPTTTCRFGGCVKDTRFSNSQLVLWILTKWF